MESGYIILIVLGIIIFLLIVYYVWIYYKFIQCCKIHKVHPENVRRAWNKIRELDLNGSIDKMIDQHNVEHKNTLNEQEIWHAKLDELGGMNYNTIVECGGLGQWTLTKKWI